MKYAIGFVVGVLMAICVSASAQMGFIMGASALAEAGNLKAAIGNLEARLKSAEQRITTLERKP